MNASRSADTVTRFKVILVPTDFDESAELVLDHAVAIALASKARIVLFHAYPLPYVSPWGGVILPDADGSVVGMMRAAGREALAQVIANRKESGVEMSAILAMGEARACILDAVAEQHADLVVMGTHGRHGFSRMLMGSTAEGIVRMSPVPVLTVRAPVSVPPAH